MSILNRFFCKPIFVSESYEVVSAKDRAKKKNGLVLNFGRTFLALRSGSKFPVH